MAAALLAPLLSQLARPSTHVVRRAGVSCSAAAPVLGRGFSTRAPDVFDLRRTAPAIKVSKPPKSEARYLASLRERVNKIQANMKAQDKKIADYKKTLPAKVLTKGILQYIKKNAWEKE